MPEGVALDITRLYSRRGLDFDTGIDRVERAYFEEISKLEGATFVIRRGHVYTGHDAIAARALISSKRQASETQRLKRAKRIGWRRIKLPNIHRFYHIGHSAHPEQFWRSLDRQGLNTTIFIHDVIPLDYPQFMRNGSSAAFTERFKLWSRYGDRFLTSTQTTKHAISRHLDKNARIDVTPLAVSNAWDCTKPANQNHFTMLGTIEPRKNHIAILHAWEKLHAKYTDKCPKLTIIGKRGWNNAETFRWLDRSPLVGKFIFEAGPLSDEDAMPILCDAATHIVASHVEGFGLTTIEAFHANRNLILSDIAVFHELFPGEDTAFVEPNNVDGWVFAIENSLKYSLMHKDVTSYRNWNSYFANHPIL